MLLNYTKIKTSTMRHRSYVINRTVKFACSEKSLLLKMKRKSGRNFSGKITIRGRQSTKPFFSAIQTYSSLSNVSFFFKNNFVNNKTCKWFNVIMTSDSSFFIVPGVKGPIPGDLEFFSGVFSKTFNTLSIGIPVFLKIVPFFTQISNICNFSFKKIQYSTSPGTFSLKLKASKKDKLLKIKLPSFDVKFFSTVSLAVIGANQAENKHGFEPGKAGVNRIAGFRPISRGVARNPVDHPNGGRTKSFQVEKSPWGWIAKKNK